MSWFIKLGKENPRSICGLARGNMGRIGGNPIGPDAKEIWNARYLEDRRSEDALALPERRAGFVSVVSVILGRRPESQHVQASG